MSAAYQVDRAVTAARAAARTESGRDSSILHGTIGTNPARRSPERPTYMGVTPRRRTAKMTKAQMQSDGSRMSDWARPWNAPFGGWQ